MWWVKQLNLPLSTNVNNKDSKVTVIVSLSEKRRPYYFRQYYKVIYYKM